MARLIPTKTRYETLRAVSSDHVRYHEGLTGPALGYTWAENAGGQMSEELRHALRELWAADLITIAPERILAQRGRRVSVTTKGEHCLQEWAQYALQPVS